MNDTSRPVRIGYKRVSSVDQNDARQLDGIAVDFALTDKASGKDTARPQLQALMAMDLAPGSVIVVHSMDRLARSVDDLRRLVQHFTGRGMAVEFVTEGRTFTGSTVDPMDNLMLSMLGAFAEFERAMIGERQREGIAKAKERGVYKGRARALTADRAAALRQADKDRGGKNRAELARTFKVSRETLYQCLRSQA